MAEEKIDIVYFSSRSENTKRFVEKLDEFKSFRIPLSGEELIVPSEYVLFSPTWGAGGPRDAVPGLVKRFLNIEENRLKCVGVIGSGDRLFGAGYAAAGDVLASKLGKPLLYKFELTGTRRDVENVREILSSFKQFH